MKRWPDIVLLLLSFSSNMEFSFFQRIAKLSNTGIDNGGFLTHGTQQQIKVVFFSTNVISDRSQPIIVHHLSRKPDWYIRQNDKVRFNAFLCVAKLSILILNLYE